MQVNPTIASIPWTGDQWDWGGYNNMTLDWTWMNELSSAVPRIYTQYFHTLLGIF